MLQKLKDYIKLSGKSQTECASIFCIAKSHLSKILSGQRRVGARVARHLGYEEVVTYRAIKGDKDG